MFWEGKGLSFIEEVKILKKENRYLQVIQEIERFLDQGNSIISSEKKQLLVEAINLSIKVNNIKKAQVFSERLFDHFISEKEFINAWKIYEERFDLNSMLPEGLISLKELASELGEVEEKKKITGHLFKCLYTQKNLLKLEELYKKKELTKVQEEMVEELRGCYNYFAERDYYIHIENEFIKRNCPHEAINELKKKIVKRGEKKEIFKAIFDLLLMVPQGEIIFEIAHFCAREFGVSGLELELTAQEKGICEIKVEPKEKSKIEKMVRDEDVTASMAYKSFLKKVSMIDPEGWGERSQEMALRKWLSLLSERELHRVWKDLFYSFVQTGFVNLGFEILERVDVNKDEKESLARLLNKNKKVNR